MKSVFFLPSDRATARLTISEGALFNITVNYSHINWIVELNNNTLFLTNQLSKRFMILTLILWVIVHFHEIFNIHGK